MVKEVTQFMENPNNINIFSILDLFYTDYENNRLTNDLKNDSRCLIWRLYEFNTLTKLIGDENIDILLKSNPSVCKPDIKTFLFGGLPFYKKCDNTDIYHTYSAHYTVYTGFKNDTQEASYVYNVIIVVYFNMKYNIPIFDYFDVLVNCKNTNTF